MDSAIGLSLMIAIGPDDFAEMLAGFRAMDEHFLTAPLERNLPVLLGLLGIWYGDFFGFETHAVLPYSQELSRFPAYLQQLEMESNGKRVDVEGRTVDFATTPALWGGTGTPGQHAFHQWLHQGTETAACDFIVAARPMGKRLDDHQRLLAHACAQSEALMNGIDRPEAHRACPGGRVSTTIVMPALDAWNLGALLAIYEHKVFAQARIWGINPFDQWGVERGKELAGALLPAVSGGETPPGTDESTVASLGHLRDG
jgi:glucose-6-phosphate isomerase